MPPELKPNTGSAFADPPAGGFFGDDPETVPTRRGGIALPNLWSKPRAFIDDFDEQALTVELNVYLDSPAAVNDRVGHELANQQPRLLARLAVQFLRE
jgi:hypothetical protein